jgi:ribosomal protein S18 acetylase RimI-like enzyme
MTNTELSRQCELNANAASATTRTVIEVGPFQALLDPATDMIWLNYAVPISPIDPPSVAAALVELRRVFAQHQRTIRFEFNALPWPELAGMLEEDGLVLHGRHPLMVCTPSSFRPFQAPGVTVVVLNGDEPEGTIVTYMQILRESFDGLTEPPPAADVERFRERIRTGPIRSAMALLNGVPAGAGSTIPIAGVAELGGVATSPAFRRRGVAATISSFLTKQLFDQGGSLAWLSAADAAAQAVYQRVGYAVIDERLNYIAANALTE